jgi:hypothetical protein
VAYDVDVDGKGCITVVGYGYHQTLGRSEAVVWRSLAVPTLPRQRTRTSIR